MEDLWMTCQRNPEWAATEIETLKRRLSAAQERIAALEKDAQNIRDVPKAALDMRNASYNAGRLEIHPKSYIDESGCTASQYETICDNIELRIRAAMKGKP